MDIILNFTVGETKRHQQIKKTNFLSFLDMSVCLSVLRLSCTSCLSIYISTSSFKNCFQSTPLLFREKKTFINNGNTELKSPGSSLSQDYHFFVSDKNLVFSLLYVVQQDVSTNGFAIKTIPFLVLIEGCLDDSDASWSEVAGRFLAVIRQKSEIFRQSIP